jgi:K+/H+ antiporter YhaU regulatory subunit KhtT
VIVTISLLVNRIATVALTFTGLSRDTARFQSRVAFTGAGFTTSESELITTHPVRRRIVMMLMFLGNAGLVTVMATLMTGFVNIDDKKSSVDLSEYSIQMTDDAGNPVPNRALTFRKVVQTDPDEVRWRDVFLGVTPQQQFVSRMLVLVLGILTLWMVASSTWVDEQTFKIIGGMLKRFTRLDNHDFSGILHLSEGYTVSEIEIGKEHWMVGRNLMTLRLSEEGVQVLGVMRSDKTYIGAPTGQTFVRAGDTVIVYGQTEHLDELVNREQTAEGEAAHGRRVAEHLAERQQTEQEERALLRDRTSA